MDQVGPLDVNQVSICAIAQLACLVLGLVQTTGIVVSLARWRLYARLNRCAGIIFLIWEGMRFHWLETLTLKKFRLISSFPLFTFTFRLSAATLVTVTITSFFEPIFVV